MRTVTGFSNIDFPNSPSKFHQLYPLESAPLCFLLRVSSAISLIHLPPVLSLSLVREKLSNVSGTELLLSFSGLTPGT